MNKRICENCKATYATGKDYGNYWFELPEENLEIKGLCEFCNPNSKWYVEKENKDI